MGVHRDGGFAEFVVADEKNIHKFHKDFDESLLGLVEPFTIGVEINNRGQITKGDKVLIMGSVESVSLQCRLQKETVQKLS